MELKFDQNDLRPLVKQVVAEVLEQLEADGARLDGQLAYPEPQAASLVGVAAHTLRDARLRREITGSKVGRRIVYEHRELLAFLRRNRQA